MSRFSGQSVEPIEDESTWQIFVSEKGKNWI